MDDTLPGLIAGLTLLWNIDPNARSAAAKNVIFVAIEVYKVNEMERATLLEMGFNVEEEHLGFEYKT